VDTTINLETFDLVCIGGGGAAVTAAVCAAAGGKKVALISKEPAGFGNTRMAVGMTACPGLVDGDSVAVLKDDILHSGAGLAEQSLVEKYAEKAFSSVLTMEEIGLLFNRDKKGGFSAGAVLQVGGHSQPRSIINTGGGPALGYFMRALLWRYNVTVYDNIAALELLKLDGAVKGVLAVDLSDCSFKGFACQDALIATGGCGALFYPHTTNSRGAVGDGLTLALQAGAYLQDLEQIQAIPFGITYPYSMYGALCGEPSTAGPAGKIMDRTGKIIIDGGINRMTRATVTRKIMESIGSDITDSEQGVMLDLGPNLTLADGNKIYENSRGSGIFEIIRKAYGMKAYRWQEPWRVMPTMHYQMGGIRVNLDGETGIPGLLAVGEVQAGLHGGNRLGSVALSEIFTLGLEVGHYLKRKPKQPLLKERDRDIIVDGLSDQVSFWRQRLSGNGQLSASAVRQRLEKCLWEKAGPLRNQVNLLEALSDLEGFAGDAANLDLNPEVPYNRQVRDAVELNLMLPAAKALVCCALERNESRGAHLRSDFPGEDSGKPYHTFVCKNNSGYLESGITPVGNL
jgi:succinate dehydrogenase/fumarate reductase flavoprotein subunit